MGKRIGISDVARLAGVSATTVSHALSGQGKVSPQTRLRVEEVASQLGYAPNRIASALRRQRSGIIGFVGDEVATTPFAGQLVLGAQDAAAEAGFLLMMVNSNRDAEVELGQIRALLAHQVDGIVYAKMYHREVEVPAVLGQLPVVIADAYDISNAFPSVVPDEEQIAESATDFLIAHGHRAIAHLTIRDDTPAKTGRLRGYRRALERAGVPFDPDLVIEADVERGAAATGIARGAFGRFLESGMRPSGVFCFNDQFAMGVYQVAGMFGLSIPRDLSVVGVDNLEIIAANLTPGLSTVALPHYDMGRWAVQRVVAQMKAGAPSLTSEARTKMQCYLVERDSVAVPSSVSAHPVTRA